MNKIATTIEQSKKLIELGIDVNSADMRYGPFNPDIPWVWVGKPLIEKDAIPAWSLSALIELMPHAYYDEKQEYCKLSISKDSQKELYIFYNNSKNIGFGYHNIDYIEAAYKMIVWLIENNYFKTEK